MWASADWGDANNRDTARRIIQPLDQGAPRIVSQRPWPDEIERDVDSESTEDRDRGPIVNSGHSTKFAQVQDCGSWEHCCQELRSNLIIDIIDGMAIEPLKANQVRANRNSPQLKRSRDSHRPKYRSDLRDESPGTLISRKDRKKSRETIRCGDRDGRVLSDDH